MAANLIERAYNSQEQRLGESNGYKRRAGCGFGRTTRGPAHSGRFERTSPDVPLSLDGVAQAEGFGEARDPFGSQHGAGEDGASRFRTERAVFHARSQVRPDAGPLPQVVRSPEARRA